MARTFEELPETKSYAKMKPHLINFFRRSAVTLLTSTLTKSPVAIRLQRASEAARATLSKRPAGEHDGEKPVQLSWGSAMRR